MSLYIPSAGGLQLLQRMLVGRGGVITAATNATPTVVTAGSGPIGASPANVSGNHGLSNGMAVRIDGATGNTNINGTFIVGSVTATTFQIYPTTTGTGGTAVNGNGALGGSPYWTLWGMEDVALKLYSSNTTPSESDVAGTYTEVANGSGYTTGGQTITSVFAKAASNVWAPPLNVAAGGTGAWAASLGSGSTNVPEAVSSPTLTWTWTGSVSAYGYLVVGSTTGNILWSERFSNPPKNFSSADSLTITARFGLTHS